MYHFIIDSFFVVFLFGYPNETLTVVVEILHGESYCLIKKDKFFSIKAALETHLFIPKLTFLLAQQCEIIL